MESLNKSKLASALLAELKAAYSALQLELEKISRCIQAIEQLSPEISEQKSPAQKTKKPKTKTGPGKGKGRREGSMASKIIECLKGAARPLTSEEIAIAVGAEKLKTQWNLNSLKQSGKVKKIGGRGDGAWSIGKIKKEKAHDPDKKIRKAKEWENDHLQKNPAEKIKYGQEDFNPKEDLF